MWNLLVMSKHLLHKCEKTPALFPVPERDNQLILTDSGSAWQRRSQSEPRVKSSIPPKGLFIDDITEVREGGSSERPAEQRWNRPWHAAQLYVPPPCFLPLLFSLFYSLSSLFVSASSFLPIFFESMTLQVSPCIRPLASFLPLSC